MRGTAGSRGNGQRFYYADGARTVGSPAGGGAEEGRVAERYQAADKARDAELKHTLKVLGRCRYCGAALSGRTLQRSPGVCGRNPCVRHARREAKDLRAARNGSGQALTEEGPGADANHPPSAR